LVIHQFLRKQVFFWVEGPRDCSLFPRYQPLLTLAD
jgi:hypothetical protein